LNCFQNCAGLLEVKKLIINCRFNLHLKNQTSPFKLKTNEPILYSVHSAHMTRGAELEKVQLN